MVQLAPLLGQLRLGQTLMMFPLSKISVLVHAECWYRPVSTTGLPTARGAWRVSRRDSGFSIVSDGAKRQLVTGPRPPFLLWKKFLLLAAPTPESRPVFGAALSCCRSLRQRLTSSFPLVGQGLQITHISSDYFEGFVNTPGPESPHRVCEPYTQAHGKDSSLRRWGLHLAARGGKQARNGAVVAAARKLAVLLQRIWATQESYTVLRRSSLRRNARSDAQTTTRAHLDPRCGNTAHPRMRLADSLAEVPFPADVPKTHPHPPRRKSSAPSQEPNDPALDSGLGCLRPWRGEKKKIHLRLRR